LPTGFTGIVEEPAMKVVVTGAAGYIGAATVARLLDAGHTVAGLDCLRFGGTALLGSYLTGRFSLTRGDIRDRTLVARVFADADAVVHLAGIVGDPACAAEPDLACAVNLDAAVALHEAAGRAGVARFVFASTCSVYGHCASPADEAAPLNPLSLYAQNKVDAETQLLGAVPGGMATTVLRFATVYGLAPRMRFDLVVNTLVAHALTTGRVQVFTPAAWRPLIHVADVADAITSVVQAPAATVGTQVFNVGSADNWQLADVARLVAGICGPGVRVDISPVDGDARDYRITTSKLSAATGWTACRTLRDGIEELANALSAGVLDGHPALGGPRAA
jgi:nucleoside-diphosphate-sugar epimerase